MRAIAQAMAVLCALIGDVLVRCSGTPEKLPASERLPCPMRLFALIVKINSKQLNTVKRQRLFCFKRQENSKLFNPIKRRVPFLF
jgi:hypothetical protein